MYLSGFSSGATGRVTFLVLSEMPQKIVGRTAMKFAANIHAPLRMGCNHFDGSSVCDQIPTAMKGKQITF